MPPRHRRASIEGPDPIDIHVGARLRLRRTLLGLTQSTLAEQLNLSFQQVQKYENGRNRISASMLHCLAGILAVPVGFFFDDLPEEQAHPPAIADDVILRRESLDLMRYYYCIADDLRRQVYELVRQMARLDRNGPAA